jgi:hypothetical protein
MMPVIAPLAGLSIGRDLADIQTQYERAPKERDFTLTWALSLRWRIGYRSFTVSRQHSQYAAPLSIGIPTVPQHAQNMF